MRIQETEEKIIAYEILIFFFLMFAVLDKTVTQIENSLETQCLVTSVMKS